jgi:3-oxoacyl-[acyl-carrier-protein] synthase II
MNEVCVTGLGCLTAVGNSLEETWQRLIAGETGIGLVTLFDAENFQNKIAAEVKGFDPSQFMLPQVHRKADRFAQFGIAAAKMAIEDSGLGSIFSESKINNVPVIIGSGLGGSLFHEEQIFKLIGTNDPRHVLSSSVPRITPNAVSAHIAMEHKLHGINLTISTACSSGANAIAIAARMIQQGEADIAVTGGVECPVTPFTYAAYQSLRVLAPGNMGNEKQPRPFDKDRAGFLIGEGAGIIILESVAHAKRRNAKIYATLAGWYSNCGAYHIAAPEPNGDDAALAIEMALKISKINPNQVDYINAHGTATKMNDVAESKAFKKIFGPKTPYVSSTKSQTGHTIGAAGAIEAIFSIMAIKDDVIPGTVNCENQDEECDINVVKKSLIGKNISCAMSTSFGFGSNNSVLIFKKIN